MSCVVRLTIKAGPLTGLEYEFNDHDLLIFGRSRNCQIHLPKDSYISRHHFVLEVKPPDVFIRDLGSRNGTVVNGVKHSARVSASESERKRPIIRLSHNDIIKVGKTIFHLRIDKKQPKEVHSSKVQPALGEIWKSEVTPSCLPEIPGFVCFEKLGEGGMGVVYRGARLSDAKPVAIKAIVPKVKSNLQARAEFSRECQVLCELVHPHIVSILDVGEVDDRSYCVLEFCNQGCLSSYLSTLKTPMPIMKLARLFAPVLDALCYAHSRGIIHRDIKPDNILTHVTGRQPVLKLSDFGLAKSFQSAGLSGMTVTGDFAVTYSFMPREQLTQYKYLNPQSDLWSLAATFYFFATGKLPREETPDDDPIGVILNHHCIPIRKRDRTIPAGLARIIDRALHIEPDRRFASAKQMSDEFNALLK